MTAKHYLLYGSERYALAILRPLHAAIRERGHEAAWFFDGPGGAELQPGETLLPSTDAVRDFAPIAVLTSLRVLSELRRRLFRGICGILALFACNSFSITSDAIWLM